MRLEFAGFSNTMNLKVTKKLPRKLKPSSRVITVLAIGIQERNKLLIGGEEFEP